MKKNFLKFAMVLAVFCLAFSACKKEDNEEEVCEDCYTVSAVFISEKICESDLASPEAYKDSLAAAQAFSELTFLTTVEESVECK